MHFIILFSLVWYFFVFMQNIIPIQFAFLCQEQLFAVKNGKLLCCAIFTHQQHIPSTRKNYLYEMPILSVCHTAMDTLHVSISVFYFF